MRLASIVVAGLITTSIGVQSATTNQPQTYNDPFAQMDKIFEMQMRQMEMMKEHMDKLFNNFEHSFKSSTFKTMPIMINSSGIFSSGFKDKKSHYELKIKVHNLKDSKVNITAENGMLTVEIIENKKIERTHGNYGKIISYTNSNSVQSFTLPSDADSTKIEAKQKGSEIVVTVPKREKPKSIPIKKEENLSKK